jgi:hypothetical protein
MALRFSEISDFLKRGVCAIVTKREAGCDGRDGDARDFSCGRTALMRTAKSCGPGAPTLALSEQNDLFATVATSPVTGESTYNP